MSRNGSGDWGTSSSLSQLPELALVVRSLATALLFPSASPLAIVVVLSIVIGLLMILVFGYTSNQKAIKIAKDQLKAHLLAVRLFQEQLHVVVGSYGRILRGTGRYLRFAFMPLLYVIIPITLLIIQVDRYLGATAIHPNTAFLLTAKVSNPDSLDGLSLELPPGIDMTSPPVHVSADGEVVWRLEASKDGAYEVKVAAAGQSVGKSVQVSSGIPRLSPVRLRGHFWERLFFSAESALPDSSPVESIAVSYPERTIDIVGYGMNWIWLFFILSMIAGFIFKELLGIQV